MYTLLYLKWITNKVLLYGTRNSAQYDEAAWIGEELWKEWIHFPPETITKFLIGSKE